MVEAKHKRKSVKDYVKPKVSHCPNHRFVVGDKGKVYCEKCGMPFEPKDGEKRKKDRMKMFKRTRDVKMPPARRSH